MGALIVKKDFPHEVLQFFEALVRVLYEEVGVASYAFSLRGTGGLALDKLLTEFLSAAVQAYLASRRSRCNVLTTRMEIAFRRYYF